MGSRRSHRKKVCSASKRAKGQKMRRQKERDKKIKDNIEMEEVTPLPVTDAAVHNDVTISNNNVPLGQQNGILQVTPTLGFPTPTATIQANGILVLLNRAPQVVLPNPTIFAAPQQNSTVVEGCISAKYERAPPENFSTTPNALVSFAQGSSVTLRKEIPVSSKDELDIIKENLISKGTELRIIESSVRTETADSRAKTPLVSSEKVDSSSAKVTSRPKSANLVRVKKRNNQKCCIIDCGQERTCNGPSIHAFPKSGVILTKWLDSIGDRMLPRISGAPSVICGHHFEQSCFVKSYNRKPFKTLKPGSVPTIFPSPSDSATEAKNPRKTGNNDTSLVYDCQIKVEPVDDAEPCAAEYLKAANLPETSGIGVTEAQPVDWDFNLEDMSCPEKAKLYYLKVQKELALYKMQQKEPTTQCEPPTVQVKQEIVVNSDDEQDGNPEKKRQKMKTWSTNFQKEGNKCKATGDKPTPEQDEFDAYAVTVAAKLRKMNSKQRMFAENMINQILYKGLMHQLSAGTQTTENPQTPPVQSQTMSSCPNIQQSQLPPLFALSINPPQIQGTLPFQNQTFQSTTLQESTFRAILPSRTLGQFSTTHFPDRPIISSLGQWTPGGSAM